MQTAVCACTQVQQSKPVSSWRFSPDNPAVLQHGTGSAACPINQQPGQQQTPAATAATWLWQRLSLIATPHSAWLNPACQTLWAQAEAAAACALGGGWQRSWSVLSLGPAGAAGCAPVDRGRPPHAELAVITVMSATWQEQSCCYCSTPAMVHCRSLGRL